jgi:hypothetical protein
VVSIDDFATNGESEAGAFLAACGPDGELAEILE